MTLSCTHPEEQQARTVYYLMCGGCKAIRLVTYCNYPTECHSKCGLAPVCVQPAREKFHAAVSLAVDATLIEAARATIEAR